MILARIQVLRRAAGRFTLVVLAGAAEMERNLTRERTRSAMAVKKSNGQRIGAVPFGFDLANDGTTLTPNEREQAIIRDMRTMKASGMTLREIAFALTERGVPTKTGKSNPGRIKRWRGYSGGQMGPPPAARDNRVYHAEDLARLWVRFKVRAWRSSILTDARMQGEKKG